MVRAELPVAQVVTSASAPRALAWCAALLDGPKILERTPREVRDRGVDAQVAFLRDLKEHAVNRETLARQFWRATRRLFEVTSVRLNLPRTRDVALGDRLEHVVSAAYKSLDDARRDLLDLRPALMPVRHVVEGEAAVRAYLDELVTKADAINADLESTAAHVAPGRPKRVRQFVGAASAAGMHAGVAYVWSWVTLHAALFHPVVLVVSPAFYAFTVGRGMVGRMNRLYLNVRGIFDAAVAPWRAAGPVDLARDSVAVVADIRAALDRTDQCDEFIYSSTTFYLPQRQWDSYGPKGRAMKTRRVPTRAELEAAVRTYGWRPPADARRPRADLVFFRRRDGTPVLISLVREPRYAQDL